jgi:D-alanyl-D-alanine dipeptidase
MQKLNVSLMICSIRCTPKKALAEAQRNRLLLNGIMFGGGFVGISSEWWHFELPRAAGYPLLDDRFACL